MEDAAARELLARAQAQTLSATTDEGRPLLRKMHGAMLDGALYFHGSRAGQKSELEGRWAVVATDEVVARIPSYFRDPERACPATTLYRSAQGEGPVTRVTDPDEKARALQALMEHLQPEGGHVPLDAAHPLYKNAIKGLMVLRLDLHKVVGRSKLGQRKTPVQLEAMIDGLWRRGAPGDLEAIEAILEANPGRVEPAFTQRARAPEGVRLCASPGQARVPEAVRLVRSAYWNVGLEDTRIADAHRWSPAWVGAVDGEGALVATARATGDRAKRVWIYDVMVDSAWRGRGVGAAVMRLLLDHPFVRGCARVFLATRDAQDFYAREGFVEAAPTRFSVMLRDQGSTQTLPTQLKGEGQTPSSHGGRMHRPSQT